MSPVAGALPRVYKCNWNKYFLLVFLYSIWLGFKPQWGLWPPPYKLYHLRRTIQSLPSADRVYLLTRLRSWILWKSGEITNFLLISTHTFSEPFREFRNSNLCRTIRVVFLPTPFNSLVWPWLRFQPQGLQDSTPTRHYSATQVYAICCAHSPCLLRGKHRNDVNCISIKFLLHKELLLRLLT